MHTSAKFVLKSVVSSLVFFGICAASQQSQSSFYRQINYNLVNTQNNSTNEVCAERWLGQCVRWRTETDLRTVASWDDATTANARAALSIVADRMLNSFVAQCALDNAKKEFHEGLPVTLSTYDDFRTFFWGQLSGLLQNGFPQVHVQIDQLAHGRAGEAEVGNFVDSRFNGRTHVVSGRYYFSMDKEYMESSDINQIAGVMAHEMLHQMGYSHPEGYDDENFVSVFQNCFINEGTYAQPGSGLTATGAEGITPWVVRD